MYPIEVEGIMFWGKKAGWLNQSEVERITLNMNSVLHMLRHFQTVPTEWKNRIIQSGVEEKTIEMALSQPGSKWNSDISALETPESVTQSCKMILDQALHKKRALRWIQKGNLSICRSSHLLTTNEREKILGDCRLVIGTQGIISLEMIPKGAVIKEKLREVSPQEMAATNVVRIEAPFTNRIVIVLAKKSDNILMWTSYPGILVPSIPRPNQLPEERYYNQLFWEKHALIE